MLLQHAKGTQQNQQGTEEEPVSQEEVKQMKLIIHAKNQAGLHI